MPGDVFCKTNSITVIADSIVEEKETFSLSLQPLDKVNVSNEVATVTIFDGDGKKLRKILLQLPKLFYPYIHAVVSFPSLSI